MNNPHFSKIEKDLPLSEKIEQKILAAILQKIFLPGDKLVGEMELAQNFGVSRTVVREALHRLAGRGYVEIRKNSGVFVSTNQFSTLTESLYHLLEMKCGDYSLLNIAIVRLIIEPEVARLAALKASKEDIALIKNLLLKMEDNISDPKKMIQYDIEFHRSILMATKNPIFPVIMEPIFQLMYKFISQTYEYPHSPLLALKSHHNILHNIEQKDGEGVFEAMKAHLKEARDHALEVSKMQLKEFPEFDTK
jgi:GntR family transcriptional repressor for pyruvate dehydrogenase complex